MKNSMKNKIVAASSLVVSASILIPIPTFANSSTTIVRIRQSPPTQTSQSSSSSYRSITTMPLNTTYQNCISHNVPVGSPVKQCTHPSTAR